MARNLITSDIAIRSIKPGDPRTRLNDGDGLFLLLFMGGGGSHGLRFDYHFGGKRNLLSFGKYPDTDPAQHLEPPRRRHSIDGKPTDPRKDVDALAQAGRASVRRMERSRFRLSSMDGAIGTDEA